MPDFIVEIRKLIGHQLLWLPGVTALVQDDAGRLLLGQRADVGHWALIAGIPDPGEEMAAAVVREVAEETGVRVVVTDLIAIWSTAPITYPNGDVTQFVTHLFRARPVGGTAHVADDESLAVGWFAPDDLPAPVSPGVAEALALAAGQARTGRAWFPA